MKTRNPKRKRESANGRCLQQLVRRLRDGIPVKSIKEESGWEKTEYDLPAAILLMMDAADIIERLSQYLAKIGAKGGKAKSAAKTAAARKANAARWRNHKPKRVTATPNAHS
jgi:hypothetical protein